LIVSFDQPLCLKIDQILRTTKINYKNKIKIRKNKKSQKHSKKRPMSLKLPGRPAANKAV